MASVAVDRINGKVGRYFIWCRGRCSHRKCRVACKARARDEPCSSIVSYPASALLQIQQRPKEFPDGSVHAVTYGALARGREVHMTIFPRQPVN